MAMEASNDNGRLLPMIDPRPAAIFLAGPTASGKTDLAVAISEYFDVSIISVDSALVYRGMDIGTAKPGAEVLARVPHYLIDIREPHQSYSAADFCTDALAAMDNVRAQGRIPLLTGGTMLYFRALEHGLSPLPGADAEVRADIEQEAVRLGWPAMHDRLARIDPLSGQRIHQNDPQRIQRALEVYRLTGTALSELQQQAGRPFPWRAIRCALGFSERQALHERIALRLHSMLEEGFLNEVEMLHKRPQLTAQCSSMRAVGYRQLWAFLEGEYGYAEACEKALVATRQLAKRQLTWLRREKYSHCFEATKKDLLNEVLKTLHNASI